MNHHGLVGYFLGVAVKRLSAVEADQKASNQHEYNGTKDLQRLFGPEDRHQIPTKFLYLSDDHEAVAEAGFLTWYDARRAHPSRSEYRLYYHETAVSRRAVAQDTLFIALRADGSALVIVTVAGSTTEGQLLWLFGLAENPTTEFVFRDVSHGPDSATTFLQTFILSALGIEVAEPSDDEIEKRAAAFVDGFPTTRALSEIAQKMLTNRVSPKEDPDGALLAWMEQEERLFRAIERRLVADRLEKGFSADIEGFISFSLSVQNRRKSRAGFALGNHVEEILKVHGIGYRREATTEKRFGPDFLFPSEAAYHDEHFPSASLRMLAVKTSCKDRWRQVLAEADRIKSKHLLTLEPRISMAQTSEMRISGIQLVIPKAIQASFSPAQLPELMSVQDFLLGFR